METQDTRTHPEGKVNFWVWRIPVKNLNLIMTRKEGFDDVPILTKYDSM